MPKRNKTVKVVVEVTLGDYDFQCKKCKTIHHKAAYCIAQQAMGHKITFTCPCNNKFTVPE